MKIKHLIIFGVLLLLLVAAVVLKHFQKPPELATEDFVPLHFSLDAAQVAKIEIGKGKDPKIVELAKNETGAWILPTFFKARADEKKIQNLFKAIREATGELRAKDKALFPDFGLADDTAFRINFLGPKDQPIFILFLGTKVTHYAASFIRKAGADQVFYTEADLYAKIGLYEDPEKTLPQNDFWAGLIPVTPQLDMTDEILAKRFTGGKEIITSHVRREVVPGDLSKKIWKYQRPGVPFALDADKIKQYLKSFETRTATKALDPKAKDYGFSKPKWQMKLHQDNGQEILITAGGDESDKNAVFLQVSNEPVVYQISNYQYDGLNIDDSNFFVANPLAVDSETLEKIFIHSPSGEVNISPKTDKRAPVTQYMNNLKGLLVSKLAFDPAQKINSKSGQLNWIEIKKEGVSETFFLDVEGAPIEPDKNYLAQKRDGTQPFLISESTFKNLFQNLDALKPAPETSPK